MKFPLIVFTVLFILNNFYSQEIIESISIDIEKKQFIKKVIKDDNDNIKVFVSNQTEKTKDKSIDLYTFDKNLKQIDKQAIIGSNFKNNSSSRFLMNDNLLNYITYYDEGRKEIKLKQIKGSKEASISVNASYNICEIFENNNQINIVIKNKKMSNKTIALLDWYVYDLNLNLVSKNKLQTPTLKNNISWYYLHHEDKLVQFKISKTKESKLSVKANILTKKGDVKKLLFESSTIAFLNGKKSLGWGYPFFSSIDKNEIYLAYPSSANEFSIDIFDLNGSLKHTSKNNTLSKYYLGNEISYSENFEYIEYLSDNLIGLKFPNMLKDKQYFIFNNKDRKIDVYGYTQNGISTTTPPSILLIKEKYPNIYNKIKTSFEYGKGVGALNRNYSKYLKIDGENYLIVEGKENFKLIKYVD